MKIVIRKVENARLTGPGDHQYVPEPALVSWFNSPSGPISSTPSVLACSNSCAANSCVPLVCFATGSSVSVKINPSRQTPCSACQTKNQIHRQSDSPPPNDDMTQR